MLVDSIVNLKSDVKRMLVVGLKIVSKVINNNKSSLNSVKD